MGVAASKEALMTDAKKREVALRKFKEILDDYVVSQKKIVAGVRMNFWTVYWLFGNSINKHSPKERGDEDWPHGAFAYLGDPYNAYMYVDNRLQDRVYEIDFEKD